MSPEDFTHGEIRVRGDDGKWKTLKWNEPRPALQSRPSRMVEPQRLGLAGVRLRAEAILAKNCGPDEIDALRELGPEVRQVLIKMAARTDDCEPYCQQRVAAVSAIGELGVGEAQETLRNLAADPNEQEAVRTQSILALGRIGSDAAIDYLAHVAETYKSPTIRATAVAGLGMSGNLRAVKPLVRALADADSDVRRRAHAGIGAMEKLHGTKLADVKAPPPVPQLRRPDRNRRAEELFQRRERARGH